MRKRFELTNFLAALAIMGVPIAIAVSVIVELIKYLFL